MATAIRRQPARVGRRVLIDGGRVHHYWVNAEWIRVSALMDRWKLMWLSLNLPTEVAGNGAVTLQVIGRVKAGVALKEAALGNANDARQLAVTYLKENAEWPTARVPSGRTGYLKTFRSTLWLFCSSGLGNLISCTNFAGLLIARGESASRELGDSKGSRAPTHRS